jgi:hypothetical protein
MEDDIFGEHEKAIEAYYYMLDRLGKWNGRPITKYDQPLYQACSIVFKTLKEYYRVKE